MTQTVWAPGEAEDLLERSKQYLDGLGYPHGPVGGDGIEWGINTQVGRWQMAIALPSSKRIVRFESGVRLDGNYAETVRSLDRLGLEDLIVRIKILLLSSNVDYQIQGAPAGPLQAVGFARHITSSAYDAQALFASLLRLKDCIFKVLVAVEAAAAGIQETQGGPRKIRAPGEESQATDIGGVSKPLMDQIVGPDTWDRLHTARRKDETIEDVVSRLLDQAERSTGPKKASGAGSKEG